MINKYREPSFYDKRSTEGFLYIRDNLYWAPCGMQWKWGDYAFGAVGGAFSIDREGRTEGFHWWPEEVIDDEKASDIIDVTEPNSVDVMFAHDAPSYIDMFHHMYKYNGQKPLPIKESMASRIQLGKIVDHWNPRLFIHGHWHIYYNETIDMRRHIGLNKDREGEENICILHVSEEGLRVTEPTRMTASLVMGS